MSVGYQNYTGAWLQESGASTNSVWGTSGNDTLIGTAQNDSIIPNGGWWDVMTGGQGDDTYWGTGGITEYPGQGVDTIRSWSSVTLPANVENAYVFGDGSFASGNSGDNIIQGAEGKQFIYGGTGSDVLIGGAAADTFVIVKGDGAKVIQDFSHSDGDVVRLTGSNLYTMPQVQAAMTQQGADVALNNGGEALLFRNATVSQFTASDFQLPLNYAALGTPTFNEDFNALKLNDPATGAAGWVPHLGYGGETGEGSFNLGRNGEQQAYVSPRFQGTTGSALGLNPFSVDNGVLTIEAKPVDQATANEMWGLHYTSGALTTQGLFAQKYGYFEMRADIPEGQGLWPAFWMAQPGTYAEIDVLEAIGSDPNTILNATHSASMGDLTIKNFVPTASGFHTYGVLWDPSNITFYLDGNPILKTATPAEMNSPMYMIVNLAVGGNWPGSPDSSTPFPADMKIDYVRAYNLPGAAPVDPPPATPPPITPPTTPPVAGGLIQGDNGAAVVGTAAADTIIAGRGGGTLTGGDGADTFVFKSLPWSAGHITDFAVGVDKLDLSALFTASGYTGSDPVGDHYLSLASDGAGGTRVYYDPDGTGSASPWPTLITVLDNVSPSVAASTLLGTSSGGGASGQTLTQGDNGAAVTGTTAADTIIAGRGGGALTGGAGADTFAFKALPWSASHITDFTVGSDRLDLSALFKASGYTGSDPVGDHYLSLASDGAGGTRVYYDPDGAGSASPWPTLITVLDNVSPSVTASTLLGTSSGGAAGGQTLTQGDDGAAITGTAAADTLVAGRAGGNLTGGDGADAFVFKSIPWSAGHITDFVAGLDKLDLRALFSAAGYAGSDPVADHYLSFTADGAGGTRVWFDADGAGAGSPWPSLITTLDHVTPQSLGSGDWLFH